MAKDKEGHGSEAHREGHKPKVEQGKYGNGTEFHNGLVQTSKNRYSFGGKKFTENYKHKPTAFD
jgi:hypothetical protein